MMLGSYFIAKLGNFVLIKEMKDEEKVYTNGSITHMVCGSEVPHKYETNDSNKCKKKLTMIEEDGGVQVSSIHIN